MAGQDVLSARATDHPDYCLTFPERRERTLNAVIGRTALGHASPFSGAEKGCTPAPGQDHRETAETYGGELFRLGRYRVAVCRDGIQWLFQRQRPSKSAGGAAWDTLGYCATRAGPHAAPPDAYRRRGPRNRGAPRADRAEGELCRHWFGAAPPEAPHG